MSSVEGSLGKSGILSRILGENSQAPAVVYQPTSQGELPWNQLVEKMTPQEQLVYARQRGLEFVKMSRADIEALNLVEERAWCKEILLKDAKTETARILEPRSTEIKADSIAIDDRRSRAAEQSTKLRHMVVKGSRAKSWLNGSIDSSAIRKPNR